jgi:hypothetical protein
MTEVFLTLTDVFLNLTDVFLTVTEVFHTMIEVFLTLTEVSPCFFLSCKASARVKTRKDGARPHSSTLFVIWVVRLLFVLFYVLFVCKCVLPPGDNQIAVNKYINTNIIVSAAPYMFRPLAVNIFREMFFEEILHKTLKDFTNIFNSRKCLLGRELNSASFGKHTAS